MQDLSMIQTIGVILAVSGALIAPTAWFYRHTTSRLESDNQKIITKLELSNKDQFSDLKTDLREFRTHFDSKISEVYIALDTKNRELKDFLLKEIDYVRAGIEGVDRSVTKTSERTHDIEKDLLRLHNKIVSEYMTKVDVYELIRKKGD